MCEFIDDDNPRPGRREQLKGSIFSSNYGDSGFPASAHVSVGLTTFELERMLDPDFNINDEGNRQMLPMYESLKSIIQWNNCTDVEIGFHKLLPQLLGTRDIKSHRRSGEIENNIIKEFKVCIQHSIDSIRSSGFQGDDDPMKPFKQHIVKIEKLTDHETFPLLIDQLYKEKILEIGVYLSGGKKTMFDNLNPTEKYEYLPHWIRDSQHGRFIYTLVLYESFRIVINSNWVMIKHLNKWYIGSRDLYIMFTDLLTQRNNGLFISVIADLLDVETYLKPDEYLFALQYGDLILSQFGNEGYKIIAEHEPLVTAVLLDDEDEKITDKTLLLDHTRKTYMENDIGWIPENAETFFESQVSFCRSLKDITPHKVSQYFGMSKLWGNPIVNPVDSFEKLKSITQVERCAPTPFTDLSNSTFFETFSIRWREKTGHWPICDVSKLPDYSLIKRAILSNSSLGTKSLRYNIYEWLDVRFEKNFDIKSDFDLKDLIADKTLSLELDEIIESLQRGQGLGSAPQRSVLVQFLKRSYYDIEKFLFKIDEEGFDPRAKVIALRIKELESKFYGRLFGMTTFVMRSYIVITESLLKKYLIKIFPEITTTDDFVKLTTSLMDKTHKMNFSSGRKNVVVSLDFEKWNSNLRSTDTNNLFKFMSNLFGYENLYQRTNEMFNKTFFYLSSNFAGYTAEDFISLEGSIFPPLYTGHQGGIEGLRQTGWTCKTLSDLFASVRSENVKVSIMGQGDNQVLVFSYPQTMNDESIKEHHRDIKRKLFSYLSSSGPNIKKNETWDSSILMMYGKRMVYKGVELNQSMKRLYKMYKISSEGLPTMESALSSTTANCMAATQCDTNGVIPFIINTFRSAEIIIFSRNISYLGSNIPKIWKDLSLLNFEVDHFNAINKSISTKQFTLKDIVCEPELLKLYLSKIRHGDIEIIIGILLMSSILGGYPNCYFNQLLIRSFPDPLVESIACLKRYRSSVNSEFLKVLITRIIKPHLIDQVNPCRLMKDPLCIQIPREISPGDKLKSKVSRAISEEPGVENEQYQKMYELSGESDIEIASILFSSKPLRPLLNNEVYKATPVGVATQVVSQLNKTSTLTRLTVSCYKNDVLAEVLTGDENFFSSVIFNLISSNVDDELECSVDHADILRELSWKREDIEGLSTSYPFELLVPKNHIQCSLGNDIINGYVLTRVSNNLNFDNPNFKSIGRFKPNLGTNTKERYSTVQKQFIFDLPSMLRRAAKLMRLPFWAIRVDGKFNDLIKHIVSCTTDADLDFLVPVNEKISGEVDHRLSTDEVDRSSATPITFNLLTHHSTHSDSFLCCRKSDVNVNVMFQTIFIGIGSVISLSIEYFPKYMRGKNIHFHLNKRSCCIRKINQNVCEIDQGIEDFDYPVPYNKESEFTFISKDRVKLKVKETTISYPFLTLTQTPDAIEHNRLYLSAVQSVSLALTNNILSNIGLTGGMNLSTSYELTGLVSIFGKSNPIDIFNHIAISLMSKIVLDLRSNTIEKMTISDIVISRAAVFSRIKDVHLQRLNVLYQHPKNRDILFARFPSAIPSSGSVWTDHDSSISSLNILRLLMDDIMSGEFCLSYSTWIVTPDTRIYSHPVVINLILHLFSQYSIDLVVLGKIQIMKTLFSHMNEFEYVYSTDLQKNFSKLSERAICEMSETDYQIIEEFHKKFQIRILDSVYDKMMKLYPCSYQVDHNSTLTHSLDNYRQSHATSISIKTRKTPHPMEKTTLDTHKMTRPPPRKENAVSINFIYKPKSGSTGAKFKIVDVINVTFVRSMDNVNFIGDMGGGSANISMIMMNLFPHAQVFFNDLIDHSKIQLNILPEAFPGSFVGFPDLRSRFVSLNLTYQGFSNFCLPEYPSWLRQNLDIDLDILISDIEGSFDDPNKEMMIAINFIKVMYLFKSRVGIMKTYFFNEIYFFSILEILVQFADVEIIRTPFSTKGKTEVYLLIYNIKVSPLALKVDGFRVSYIKTKDIVNDSDIMTALNMLKDESIDRFTYRNAMNEVGMMDSKSHIDMILTTHFPLIHIILKRAEFRSKRSKELETITFPSHFYKAYQGILKPSDVTDRTPGKFDIVNLQSSDMRDLCLFVFTMLVWASKYKDLETVMREVNKLTLVVYRNVSNEARILLTNQDLSNIDDSRFLTKCKVIRHVKPIHQKVALQNYIQFRYHYAKFIDNRIPLYRGDYFPKNPLILQTLENPLGTSAISRSRAIKSIPLNNSLCNLLFGGENVHLLQVIKIR